LFHGSSLNLNVGYIFLYHNDFAIFFQDRHKISSEEGNFLCDAVLISCFSFVSISWLWVSKIWRISNRPYDVFFSKINGGLNDVDFAMSNKEVGCLEIFVSVLCCGEKF